MTGASAIGADRQVHAPHAIKIDAARPSRNAVKWVDQAKPPATQKNEPAGRASGTVNRHIHVKGFLNACAFT